ncbi:hypothetical protein B0J13DRAFT_681229 [Dactylonectria estremocensis]|uniref:Uncharacterized protein n=1 Tax=Dactylonectria estremocensis TaxID=1079267 RepID=A0A9P9DCT9_9HYPO|nr:hypothetical protein B0J13DRAFT_681229 [Dactylonectria estremocensis]
MQLRLLISILFLPIVTVLAGGYAGAMERVWLYYAYQIDQLNDEADRTLGYKCKSWDPTKKECRPNKKGVVQWHACKGALPNRKCNFSDLLNTLGGVAGKDELAADKDGNLLSTQETNPDPKETAKNVWKHYEKTTTGNVPDYLPYRYIKDGNRDYVKCVTRVGDVVAKAVTDGKKTSDNAWLFDRFNECTEQIRFARVGDHGPFLIAEAQDKLPKDITVKKETVGPGQNPLDPTRKWETVDWEKTMSDAVSSKYDMEKLQTITQDVKDRFYLDTTAQEHRAVIQAYASVDAKIKGC